MLRKYALIPILMLPIMFLLMGNVSALALTIGVTPGKMVFNVRPGSNELQTLYVFNQSDQTSDFEVYVDGEYKKWVRITPDNFTLNGQEKKSVEIVMAPPITASPEVYDLTICVVSLPANSDLRVGAGIKVSTNVNVTQLPIMSFQWWLVSAGVLIILIIDIILIIRRMKRARHD